jgi:hypothetical protein
MASVETAITVRTMNKPTAMRDSCWRCINTGMVLPVNDPITNRQAIERAANLAAVSRCPGLEPR